MAELGAVFGPSWAVLGTYWGRPGAVLKPSWAVLGPSWGRLGAVLGRLGAVLGPSGAILGPSWDVLGRLGTVLGRLGAVLGPSWGHLGAVLGPSWGLRGPSWSRLGAVLRPSSSSARDKRGAGVCVSGEGWGRGTNPFPWAHGDIGWGKDRSNCLRTPQPRGAWAGGFDETDPGRPNSLWNTLSSRKLNTVMVWGWARERRERAGRWGEKVRCPAVGTIHDYQRLHKLPPARS